MIAAVHLRAARDAGATVAGVIASSPERGVEIAHAWGLPRGYASVDEALADDIDVLHVCTPNDTHFAYVMAAIEAGVNVICEKPLATNLADAEVMSDAATKAGVVATVPFVYRYHPLVREIRARRIAGDFGDVTLLHGSYLQDWLLNEHSSSWRVDASIGGASRAFADIGTHWCDLAEFVSGERFATVSATTSITYATRRAPDSPSFSSGRGGEGARLVVTTEDVASATFRTERGIIANTVISQVSAGRKNRLWFELDGTKGSAVFDQENPETIWLGAENEARIIHRGTGSVSSDQARLNRVPAGHPQGYPDAFAAFVADTYSAVSGATPDGLPTFSDGLRASRLIDATLKSAADDCWTAVAAQG